MCDVYSWDTFNMHYDYVLMKNMMHLVWGDMQLYHYFLEKPNWVSYASNN